VSTPSVSRSLHNRIETALFVAAVRSPDHPSKGVADTHKGELDDPQSDSRRQTRSPVREPTTAATAASSARLARDDRTSIVIEAFSHIIRSTSNCSCEAPHHIARDIEANPQGETTMDRYAFNERTIGEAVGGGGLLVVAQWEAMEGQADRIADILSRFLPEAQSEPGAKLFLISRAKENPAQFLFYELFRDEAAFKAHQESAHFKTYIAGQALPLLAKRERAQYALL
jgi:quinol monooxygenase YgiN